MPKPPQNQFHLRGDRQQGGHETLHEKVQQHNIELQQHAMGLNSLHQIQMQQTTHIMTQGQQQIGIERDIRNASEMATKHDFMLHKLDGMLYPLYREKCQSIIEKIRSDSDIPPKQLVENVSTVASYLAHVNYQTWDMIPFATRTEYARIQKKLLTKGQSQRYYADTILELETARDKLYETKRGISNTSKQYKGLYELSRYLEAALSEEAKDLYNNVRDSTQQEGADIDAERIQRENLKQWNTNKEGAFFLKKYCLRTSGRAGKQERIIEYWENHHSTTQSDKDEYRHLKSEFIMAATDPQLQQVKSRDKSLGTMWCIENKPLDGEEYRPENHTLSREQCEQLRLYLSGADALQNGSVDSQGLYFNEGELANTCHLHYIQPDIVIHSPDNTRIYFLGNNAYRQPDNESDIQSDLKLLLNLNSLNEHAEVMTNYLETTSKFIRILHKIRVQWINIGKYAIVYSTTSDAS